MLNLDPIFSNGPDDQLLDARDERSERSRALAGWLRLQAALCLQPERALAHLEASGGDPVRALARSGSEQGRGPNGSRGHEQSLARTIGPLRQGRIRALPVTSPAYPRSLATLKDAAPLLLVSGDARVLSRPAVAIVGARAATSYGLGVAKELGAEVARCGFVVVSGLARGVDAAAHRGALEAGGETIAVQACGPDRIYPPEHRDLHEAIVAAGAVISELPPGYPPRAPFFPLRNRLISGLSQVVVIVEARLRSGSLITARHAADQGRDVMAVPGPLSSPLSEGPNRLIRDGAAPLLEVGDLLGLVGDPPIAQPSISASSAETGVEPPGPLRKDRDATAILAALEQHPSGRDELAVRLQWPARRLALPLLGLELDGRVAEDRDGRLRPVPTHMLGRTSSLRGGPRKGEQPE